MLREEANKIDYYECRERYAMRQLFEKYIQPLFKNYNAQLINTQTFRQRPGDTACYDAVILVQDKITNRLEYKFIVEVKFRDSDYESLILEKQKYTSLMKEHRKALSYASPDEEVAVLYVNFTPSGAYIYDLTGERVNMFLSGKKNKEVCELVKTTYTKDGDTKGKTVYKLPKTIAKRYDYTIPVDYRLVYELDSRQMVQTKAPKTSVKRTGIIF